MTIQQTEGGRVLGSAGRVLLAAFSSGMGTNLLLLFLNFHLQARGMSAGLIGASNALPAVAMVVCGLPLGRRMARIGYVRALRLGAVTSAAGLLLLTLLRHPALMLGGLAVYGLGQALILGATAPLLAQLVPAQRQVLAMSWHLALVTGAGVLGNLGGGLISEVLGSPTTIMLAAAALFACMLLPLWTLESRRAAAPVLRVQHRPLWGRLLVPMIFDGLGAGLILPFLNIYLQARFDLSYAALGQVFAVVSLSMMLAMLIQPALVARLGKVRAIVLMQTASLPFLIVLAQAPSLPLTAGALLLRAALMNAAVPVYVALAMGLLSEDERGAFMLAQAALWNSAWALGAALSGQLQGLLGPGAFRYLFLATLGLYALATYLYLAFFSRQPADVQAGEAPAGREGAETTEQARSIGLNL